MLPDWFHTSRALGLRLHRRRARRRGQSPQQGQSMWYDRLTGLVMARTLAPDSNCVDVGANVGNISRLMVRHASQGKHIAVEPIPGVAARLRERCPHVEVVEAALSTERGVAEFQHVTTNPAYSGLRRRSYPKVEEIVPITVEVRTLDDVVGDRDIQLVKIDVEGGELDVLRGGQKILTRCRPVVLFEHGDAADGYQSSRREIFDFLHGHGYRVNTLDRWLKRRPPLSSEQALAQLERDWFFIAD